MTSPFAPQMPVLDYEIVGLDRDPYFVTAGVAVVALGLSLALDP